MKVAQLKIGDHARLKSLQVKRNAAMEAVESVNKAISDLQIQRARALADLDRVDKEIAALHAEKLAQPIVTEHAILRWLERVEGMDIEAVKTRMLTPQVLEYIANLGTGAFPIGRDNIRLRVKNGTVVTVET